MLVTFEAQRVSPSRALVWRSSRTLRLTCGVMDDGSDMCVGWVRRRGDSFMRVAKAGGVGKLRGCFGGV